MQLHPDAASTWYDLIIDGHLMQDNLKAAGRDERWLDARLHAQASASMARCFTRRVTKRMVLCMQGALIIEYVKIYKKDLPEFSGRSFGGDTGIEPVTSCMPCKRSPS